MKKLVVLMGLCGAHFFAPVLAAPLDTFLSASQRSIPGEGDIELSYDLVNDTVDVFKIRGKDADFAGTNVGNYQGAHVRAGIAITPRIWVDGALWQRGLDYRSDVLTINTWQVAGQYKLFEGAGRQPSVAVRLGAWGNYANELKKTSPTTVGDVTLNSVTVANPQDIQYQLDLIGTSRIFNNAELSVFGGAGASKVSLASVKASTTRNGCNYNISFGATEVVGTLAQPCNAELVYDRFSSPNSAYGIDIHNEAQYQANYFHAGLMLKWVQHDWQVRGGYQYQSINRGQIDNTIQSRGGKAYQSNHILMGDVMYRLLPRAAIFIRGQYLSNQFTGELPFAYNTLTASRFSKPYGILSIGLFVGF